MENNRPLIAMELDFENKNEVQLKDEVDAKLDELFRIEEERAIRYFKDGQVRDEIIASLNKEKERLRGEFYKKVEQELEKDRLRDSGNSPDSSVDRNNE